jgi:hypothetical protein
MKNRRKNRQQKLATGQLKKKRSPKSFKRFMDINGNGYVTEKVYEAQRRNRAKHSERISKGLIPDDRLGKPLSHIAMENMFLKNSPTTQVTR